MQTTVRSSPITTDKMSVCRHCHRNCQRTSQPHHHHQSSDQCLKQLHIDNNNLNDLPEAFTCDEMNELNTTTNKIIPKGECPPKEGSNLLHNSLKVQHSQSSPDHHCNINGNISRASSITSISSGTMIGIDEHQQKGLIKLIKVDEGKKINERKATKSGADQSESVPLLNDEEEHSSSQNASEADESSPPLPGEEGAINSGLEEARKRITANIQCLRKLDNQEQLQQGLTKLATQCNVEPFRYIENSMVHKVTPLQAVTQQAKEVHETESADYRVLTSVTVIETAKRITIDPLKQAPFAKPPRSPKPPSTTAINATADSRAWISGRTVTLPTTIISRSKQFEMCHCPCEPDNFNNTTLSPDQLEKETCKVLQTPQRSPILPLKVQSYENNVDIRKKEGNFDEGKCAEENISLMLIGLSQSSPASKLLNIKTPTAPMPTPTTLASLIANSFVPRIAVVPATPEAMLTKTSTQVWDNSYNNNIITSSLTASNLLLSHMPRQAIIEHIPEDSWDDGSPLDEEPPYRPMSTGLRRYGTMSSLEKLSSEDRPETAWDAGLNQQIDDATQLGVDSNNLEDNKALINHNHDVYNYDNEQIDNITSNDNENEDDNEVDADEELIMDKARADNIELDNEIRVVTKAIYHHHVHPDQDQGRIDDEGGRLHRKIDDNIEGEGDEQEHQYPVNGRGGIGYNGNGAWSCRATTFVAGKMSFFEESRAFLDKYLGRWNQDAAGSIPLTTGPNANSETDEQMDECTSGGTSGEEVWGTPTSGGDNDDLHLANSENTYSVILLTRQLKWFK